jgi:hypothetical protein
VEKISDQHGRFRVRRGELEIEYEGPDIVQEYRAALKYLNIVDGDQTRLGSSESEVMPKRVMKPHPVMTPTPEPSVALSYVEMARQESAQATPPAYDIEGQGQQSMQAPETSLSSTEGGNASEDLLFKALARASHRPGRESVEENTEERREERSVHDAEQTAEPATESKPSFQEKPLFQDKPTESEGAVPKEKYTDEKFKGILKRLGLSE